MAGAGEGATSRDGRIIGSYLHGMFTNDAFRRAFLRGLGLRGLGAASSTLAYKDGIEATLDALAAHLEAHMDVAGLLALAR